MDKKDKIILQQLDMIRSMTENNMKRMNSDFWGTPFENVTGSAPKSPAPTGSSFNGGSAPAPEKKPPLTATAKPGGEKPAEEELPPPEKIEDSAGGAGQLHRTGCGEGGGTQPHQHGAGL